MGENVEHVEAQVAHDAPQQFYYKVNNKQNSTARKDTMDSDIPIQDRRPPRSLKHIQTEAPSVDTSIINVKALLERANMGPKREQPPESMLGRVEPSDPVPFRNTVEQQLAIHVEQYLHEAHRKNKKKRMLHKKHGRRFSNPDDYLKSKYL